MDTCLRCPRILQVSAIAEITGLCDHCRRDYAGHRKTDRQVSPRRTWRQRFREMFTVDPDNCKCLVCAWDWQAELDEIDEDLY